MDFIANNWILFAALAAVVGWILMSELGRLTQGVKQVDATEATRLYNKQDGLFVDVRSEADFNKGHLPAAVHVADGQLEPRHKRLQKHKQKPVVVYCGNGMAAGRAGKKLKQEGFEQVLQLKGGYDGWAAAGLPTERK